MLKVLADENFNGDILRGMQRLNPEIDVVRAQDTLLYGSDDPTLLAWAAEENRILITHDVQTMTKYAYDRVRAGLPMPGVFEVSLEIPFGQAIEELLIIIECSKDGEWEGQVRYLPLQ